MISDPTNIREVIYLSLSTIFWNYFLNPIKNAVLFKFHEYPNKAKRFPKLYVSANLFGDPPKIPINEPILNNYMK